MVKGKVTVSPDDGVAWIEDDEATFVMRTANTGPRRVTINWATVPSNFFFFVMGYSEIYTGDSGRERTYLVSPRATTPGLQEIIIKSPPKVRAGGHAPAAARAGVVAINLSES